MYRPVPSIGSKSCLWVVGWMYQVDVHLRVRRAVMVDGMSIREVSRVFGLHRDTVRKILAYSAPPGYRRQTPPRRPKLEPFTGVIDQILVDDLRRPRKQRHTAQRIFRRLRDEHGLGHCCWTLEVVRAEVQGIRVESVLPCLRARPGGLLEREDVRAVEMQSQDGGGSGWIARKRPRSVPQLTPACARPKQEGSATTRRRSSPAGKRNGGDGPILSPCAAADRCACVRADTVIEYRVYSDFRSL